jgi:hypothetical protein
MSLRTKIMPHKRPFQIGVQIVGTRWLRFIIANQRQQVWTGNGWSDRRSDALLYAHVDVVRADVKNLKRQLRQAEQE